MRQIGLGGGGGIGGEGIKEGDSNNYIRKWKNRNGEGDNK